MKSDKDSSSCSKVADKSQLTKDLNQLANKDKVT